MGKKGFTKYIDRLQTNVNIIKSLFKDYRIIILHRYYDYNQLKKWLNNEPKLTLIDENFKLSKSICSNHELLWQNCRTKLLAILRNMLISEVYNQSSSLKYSLNSSFIISFDLDDINNKEDN
jgi:hypothetical protein